MTKLKKIRTDNRYKLKDIAQIAGVSVSAVQQWETGATRPSIERLMILSRFYGITVDELLEELLEEA